MLNGVMYIMLLIWCQELVSLSLFRTCGPFFCIFLHFSRLAKNAAISFVRELISKTCTAGEAWLLKYY